MFFLRFGQDHIFTGGHNMVAQVRNGVQTIDHIALSDEEKWRRIIASRKEQGRGLTRWESGGKKII
jgi:hypothetical protein